MTSPVSAVEAIKKAMEGVTHPDAPAWIAVAQDGRGHHGGFWTCAAATDESPRYIRADIYAALARQAEALQRENAELRAFAASFKLTCVESSFYKDCYLHISEPDSVSFRLGNGSQFSKFIAGLEDRRARALLGGSENAGN